jgi:hypothetical protein
VTTTTSFSPFGENLFGEQVRQTTTGLAGRFTVSPFSVLDAAKGEWQDRKRAWMAYGIESELGRTDGLIGKASSYGSRATQTADGKLVYTDGGISEGTSIFDPVLCELSYSWFCQPGGRILDPFAGGSVRGIVAGLLGYEYHGVDLSSDQVAANRKQAETIAPSVTPTWTAGDSMTVLAGDDIAPADLVFSCPPYADLERYSDDPRDLSTMEYHTFVAAYKRIIMRACHHLRDDRFAIFVVGDIRDPRGFYRCFVQDTISAFREQGLELYNHAILVTMTGNLGMRAGRPFDTTRKLGKRHQDVLCFVKGDPRKAANAAKGMGA